MNGRVCSHYSLLGFQLRDSEKVRMQSLLERLLSHPSDHIAIAGFGQSPMTYGMLCNQSITLGGQLRAQGISVSGRVAIVLPNGPEMAAAFASLLPWVAVAPLNPAYTADEFEFYLEDLNADLLLTQAGFASDAKQAAKSLGIRVIKIEVANQAGKISIGDAGNEPQPRSIEEISLILHTSGTTARPKKVPLTQRNVCASARNIAATLHLTEADVCLNIMPLFHIHGLIAPVLASLYAGGTVHASPGFDALKFYRWLHDVNPTWYSAVPTMHQAIVARAARNREIASINRLRFIRSSSASLPPQVLNQLEATFDTRVVEAYAMTEAAHQMCSNPLAPAPRKAGFVGPAAGPQVKIASPDKLEFQAQGDEGEIVIKGENVTPGYLDNPDANDRAFAGGWFRTGDLGYMDEDGYVKVTGRLKEIINRGGEKIAPLEVDEVLLDHPAVAQVCTFGLPDEKLGESVAALIVRQSNDDDVTTEELQAFCRERLAAFKVPRTIVFNDELPKGATGKVQRIGMAARLGLV